MRIPILLFFDDGVREDLVVAKLLAKRKLKAVFSIPLRSIGTQLHKEDILKLASVGEIASHAIIHTNLVRLVKISPSLVRKEVLYSKIYLEKICGKTVYTFTYPYGAYNAIIKRLVKEAGYLFARTMDPFNASLQNVAIHRYEVPITLSDEGFNKCQIVRTILNSNVRASFSFWLFKEAFRLSITNSNCKICWLELILQSLRRIVTDFNRYKNKNLLIILVFHSKEIFSDRDQLNLFKEILDFIANNFSIFRSLTMRDLILRLK